MRRLLIGLTALVAASYLALPVLSRSEQARRWIEHALAAATSYDVHVAAFRIGYDLSATLESLSAAANGQPFLTVERVRLNLSPWAVLHGRIGSVTLDAPQLFADRLPQPEEAAASSTPAAGERALLPSASVEVRDGFVRYTAGTREISVGPLSLVVDSLQAGAAIDIKGRSTIAGDSAGIEWSAKLERDLSDVSGEIDVHFSNLADAVRSLAAGEMPAALAAASGSVKLHFRGDPRGVLAADVDGEMRLPRPPAVVKLAGHVTGRLPREVRVQASLSTSGLDLRDADLLHAAEGLALDGNIDARWQPPEPVRIDFDVAAGAGELLWDRFYADLSRHRIGIRGQIQANPAGGSDVIRIKNAVVSVAGVGTAGIDGEYRATSRSFAFSADFGIPGLAALYELGLRDPLEEDHPLLARVAVQGYLSGAILYERDAEANDRITGKIGLSEGRIEIGATSGEPAYVARGLRIDLPLDLDTRPEQPHAGDPRSTGEEHRGSIGLAGLDIGGVTVPAVTIDVAVRRNQLAIARPVRIPVLGGELEVLDLRAEQLAAEHRTLRLGLALHDLAMAELTPAMGWPAINGTITGSIPRVTIGDGEVHSEGEIRIEVFGGDLRFQNLRVEQLFSPVPTLELGMDFQNISLGQLTDTLEVGRISGVAAGAVHDLAIVNGQPLRFEARLETVPRSGVDQRISVTAIRQLSVLGGSGRDPLTQGILSFFDEYRYAKMGFRCRLENDRFLLRGIEEIDGKQYLVVGSFMPPRVNVISHNQTISFSEMVRRLQRVFATQPADEEGARQ